MTSSFSVSLGRVVLVLTGYLSPPAAALLPSSSAPVVKITIARAGQSEKHMPFETGSRILSAAIRPYEVPSKGVKTPFMGRTAKILHRRNVGRA
jgi:hypothetical protein